MAENKMAEVAVSNFDKLLGRNGELVELRKEQVLAGAMEIVQRHYKETPNKMEVVAGLFGKKLNEEFIVKARYKGDLKCKFTNSGFYYFDECVQVWSNTSSYILGALLTGQAVIVDD